MNNNLNQNTGNNMNAQGVSEQVYNQPPVTGAPQGGNPYASPSGMFMPPQNFQNQAYVKPIKPTLEWKAMDFVFCFILCAASVFFAAYSLLGGVNLGFTISSAVFVLTTVVYLSLNGAQFSVFSVSCFASAVLAAVPFALYRDPVLHFWLFLGIIIMYLSGIVSATKQNLWSAGTAGYLNDLCTAFFVAPIKYMGISLRSVFKKDKKNTNSSVRLRSIFGGILLALPIVILIIVPLLIASDAAFEELIKKIFVIDFSEVVKSLFFGIIIFLFAFPVIYSYGKRIVKKEEAPEREYTGRISPSLISAFLSTISAVYLLYILSQLAYFTNAFGGILPEGFKVAQYARRGFFELSVLCAINILIVALCLLLVKKDENKKAPAAVRILLSFMCAFSIFITACSIAKMALYIDSFGMTRLRIGTSVFMIMLAVVLIGIIIRLFAVNFAYMKFVMVAVMLIAVIVGCADIDKTVAKYNTEVYLNGTLDDIDIDMLEGLSNSAVPSLKRIADESSDKAAVEQANQAIVNKAYKYYKVRYDNEKSEYVFTAKKDTSEIRRYNFSDRAAEEILLEAIKVDVEKNGY